MLEATVGGSLRELRPLLLVSQCERPIAESHDLIKDGSGPLHEFERSRLESDHDSISP